MLSTAAAWYLATVILVVIWLVLYVRRGAYKAMGAAVVLSILVPVWIRIPVLGEVISCRTAVAIVAMLGFCVYRRGRVLTPLTLLDFFITIMWVAHVVSDLDADRWQAGIPIRAYGEWILPYVAGRCAVQDSSDLKFLVPWIIAVAAALSICGLIESVFGVNLFEAFFGERPIDGVSRSATRFGLKRAFGNAMHPIFFGNQILLLAPWCLGLIQKDSENRLKIFGWSALLVTFLGICSTVSRGPIFAFLVLLGVMAIIRFKGLRWPAGVAVAATVVVVSCYPSDAMKFLGETTSAREHKTLVDLNGEAAEYTGTNSRLLIFDAYGDALRHAGLTGYGTTRTTGFPPNIPYLQASRHSVERLKFVDNAYVLLTLRFGFLGLGAFLLLMLTGIVTAGSLVKWFPQKYFFAAVCGSLTGFSAVLLTVWLSYDFAFLALWTMGVLSGGAIMRNDQISQHVFKPHRAE